MAWLLRISVNSAERSAIDDELLASQLWDLGTTGIFQTGDGDTVAGFETEAEAERAAALLDRQTSTIEPAPDPASLAADTSRSTVSFETDDREVALAIDAGGAFGHGGHQTTVLALDLLLNNLKPGDRVLDIGTGTGVLAIAAAVAGAGSVVAMDNDPVAVRSATNNIDLNRHLVAGPMPVRVGLWTVDQAGAELGEPADVVVMNVLLPVHRRLAAGVARAVAPNGRLITAGYLDEQQAELRSIHQQLSGDRFTIVESRQDNGWTADVFAKVLR